MGRIRPYPPIPFQGKALPFNPNEVEACVVVWHGVWMVDYDEPFINKLIPRPGRIDLVMPAGRIFSEECLQSTRTGVRYVHGRSVCMKANMDEDQLKQWITKVGRRFAEAKEELDLLRRVPYRVRYGLPLEARGNVWIDYRGDRHYLCAEYLEGIRNVHCVRYGRYSRISMSGRCLLIIDEP